MPRVCTCCTHPDREKIDAALVAGELSKRRIAADFGVAETSLRRHREHLPAALVKAKDAEKAADADDLLAQVESLRQRALGILDAAEQGGELKTALGAIREARGCIELLAELAGKLQRQGTVNILVMPEWVSLRTAVLVALDPYPEARGAVAEAIRAIE